jgi:hypothetical protein
MMTFSTFVRFVPIVAAFIGLIIAIFRVVIVRRKSQADSSTTGADTFVMNGNYYSKVKYKRNLAEDLIRNCTINELYELMEDKRTEKEEDPFNIVLELELEAISMALKLKEADETHC